SQSDSRQMHADFGFGAPEPTSYYCCWANTSAACARPSRAGFALIYCLLEPGVCARQRPASRLTRRCSENCRHRLLDAEPDLRRRAVLHHDGAGHSGADQHAGRHVRDAEPDRNALCQSDPGECWIDGGEELWTILVVLVRDAFCYAQDGSLQGGGSVHEINLGAGAVFDVGDLGFLEIRLDPV